MAEKQLIVAVEGTAALGPFWQTIISDYLEKIISCFCSAELNGQKSPSNAELSLVMFNAHGPYCAFLVQRSGWTRNVDMFLQWLSMIPFSGGGFNEAAIAEGLSEALMMFPTSQNGSHSQLNLEAQRHCILVAANNPYSLPTPVYRPSINHLEKNENVETKAESRLYDAETIAKSFAQFSISLSVICPKRLPKLQDIYNAAKSNPGAPDPSVDNVKNPQFLVLISEHFREARLALSRPGATSLPTVTAVAGPLGPTVLPVNGSLTNRQPISAGNIPSAAVKAEATSVSSIISGPVYPHFPSVQHPASQAIPTLQTSSPLTSQEIITNTENAQDMKPMVSQPLRPVGHVNLLNNLSQVRAMNSAGLQSMVGSHMAMQVSNMISSGISSSVPVAQTVISTGQSGLLGTQPIPGSGTLTGTAQVIQHSGPGSLSHATSSISVISNLGMPQPSSNIQGGVSMGQQVPGVSQGVLSGSQIVQTGTSMAQSTMSANATPGNGAMMTSPGVTQQTQSGLQQLGLNNSAGASMPLSQQTSSALQSAQSKYVKVWEGNLSGQRQGQPVFITRLEGYRSASASETLAENWPATMQIVRLISQDHMNNKQYVGKADFLVFRAMHQHGFLGQLQEKKLCAVIQLPSQTLLLSVSDKACRLIGMLFPGDMVVFKPQLSSHQVQMQQQQQQQQQLQQQQQQQQLQQQQHQQQIQLQQQQQLQVHLQQQQQPQVHPQQQQQPQVHPQQQQQPQVHPQQQQQPQIHPQQQQQPQMQLQQQQQPQQQQQLQHLQHQQLQQIQQHPQLQQQQQPQQQIPQLQQPHQLSQLQQQQRLPQIQQHQQLSPLQQQQLSSFQPQQMVGTSLGQAYVQGTGRSQLLSQGQAPSQGQPNMPGGGFRP